MKLKCVPEDFQVEELAEVALGNGPYACYRLSKRSVGTMESVEAIQQRWQLGRRHVSYGGLKDRHAVTRQYLTIQHGPPRDLRTDDFELTFLGQTDRPFTPLDIRGNRFAITVRDMPDEELRRAVDSLPLVRRDGLPNYFDDQRFGSLGASGEFIAAAWCKGDYERALWLALAEPHAEDRASEREQKQLLRAHWGDWNTCKQALERSHRRSIITFLADRPGDFRGAMARIRQDLRGLYLAAFQSAIWNRVLANYLREVVPASQRFEWQLASGPVCVFRQLEPPLRAQLAELRIQLPSSRSRHVLGPFTARAEAELATWGLTLQKMRLQHPRDTFFSKGLRAATFSVASLKADSAADDRYPGKWKLRLEFELPRGAYATILVKRLTTADPIG